MWWAVWLVTAVALGVTEALTWTLVAGILAGSALLAGVTAGLGAPLVLQLATFAIAGGVGLVAFRPIARRHMRMPPPTAEGSDALIGRQAVVIREVDGEHGLIHLAGEDWSARAYDVTRVIPAGTRVDVFEIAGATALVHPGDALDPLTELDQLDP